MTVNSSERESPAAAGLFSSVARRPLAPAARLSGALLALALLASATAAPAEGDARRGAYLAKAGGCAGCHTAEGEGAQPFAGGRALATPYGTFYGPNITPHPQAGIGRWSEADFFRAMRHGLRPDGAPYYPAFPYPSYTGITDADLRDLWAYLGTLAPSARESRPHELRFPYTLRFLVRVWRWLFFRPGPFVPDPAVPERVNRGAYLANALGHCGECHTPRNLFGALRRDRHLAGGKGPDGKDVPNLTPTRLKKWSDGELREFLTLGTTPDGDVPAEAMGEVIRNTTSQLTPEDLEALIAYLRSLPALADERR